MNIARYCHDKIREYLVGPLNQVDMAVGNRIKRSGIYRFLTHIFYKKITLYRRILRALLNLKLPGHLGGLLY